MSGLWKLDLIKNDISIDHIVYERFYNIQGAD